MDINKINTIEEVEQYRNTINEECDKRKNFLIQSNKAKSLSEKSFPYLKESAEAFAATLFESKDGRAILARYTTLLKKDNNLNKMHSLCESIRRANKDCDKNYFINNIISESWINNVDSFEKSRKKLGEILYEAYMLIGEKADSLLPQEKTTLNNAIQFIAENKKTTKTIVEYSNAVGIVSNYINENTGNITLGKTNEKNLDSIVENLVNNFNVKYGDKLSDEEIKAVKEITESTEPSTVFNTYKENCLNKISEVKEKYIKSGDATSVNKITSIQEQILKKEYTPETINTDICNLIELSNIFE